MRKVSGVRRLLVVLSIVAVGLVATPNVALADYVTLNGIFTSRTVCQQHGIDVVRFHPRAVNYECARGVGRYDGVWRTVYALYIYWDS